MRLLIVFPPPEDKEACKEIWSWHEPGAAATDMGGSSTPAAVLLREAQLEVAGPLRPTLQHTEP